MANSNPTPRGGTERTYCSELNTDESLWGTADTQDVWLCLEYRPTWKRRALTDNALAGRTQAWLADTISALAARGVMARALFVRQPDIDRDDTRLLVTAGGRTVLFSGQGYDFLRDLDLVGLMTGSAEQGGQRITEPQYLVCTNGQRDLCCARFGLPVYAALKERVGERVWQVTHLGGHRFAPNVLTLPDACLYGRVTPENVDTFLGRTEAGEVDFDRLRGRTSYPAAVQAAEAMLRRQGVKLLHVAGDESEATVQFADAHERTSIRVGRMKRAQKVAKSCGDEPVEVYPFVRL